MPDYGQTVLGAWNQAASSHASTQQALAFQRKNEQGEYEDTWNQLQIQGIVDIAKEGPNKGYATFNMERAMEILPKGGLANYLDYALKNSNLTKYEGADGRLKQGKIVGVHKITPEEDPENAGMYAIAIKNEKGVMSFLSQDRREVGVKEGRAANALGNNPLLLDAEDIQKFADIGARAILARTPQASQVAYGRMADDLEATKKRGARADAVTALAKEGRKRDLAGIGLNPDGTIDLNSPVSQQIATEEKILDLGTTDDSPDAALAQTVALVDLYSGDKTGEGPEIKGDNERLSAEETKSAMIAEEQKSLGVGPAEKGIEYKQLGLWEGDTFAQAKMKQAMREIEEELGRPEDQTPIAQDMTGPAGSPAEGNIRKVFEHLGLPTKSGVVTKEHWRQARDYMMSLKGDPTAKAVTTLDQAENKTTESKETLIQNKEEPDSEAATELQEILASEEIGTMEDYIKWADEFLPPTTRDYANWTIAAMGSGGDPAATLANYKQLSGQVERELAVSEGTLRVREKELELNKIKEMGNINSRYAKLATADGKLLTGITKNYDDVLDNYALDRKTGQWLPLDGSDKPPLQIDTIIDKGATAIANLRAAVAGNQFTTPASAKMASDRLNEMYGTMIEMLAANSSDRGTKWGFGVTKRSREAWSDFGLLGGPFSRSPTRATMGQPFNQMRGNASTIEKSDKIVFVTKAGKGVRETRNSVSKIVVANALFGASDKGAMAELDELLIKNGVKGINKQR
tara:strand:- start:245 stop:2482 length:2238 start_codon:yes stop_codon:yes gene_type:complete